MGLHVQPALLCRGFPFYPISRAHSLSWMMSWRLLDLRRASSIPELPEMAEVLITNQLWGF